MTQATITVSNDLLKILYIVYRDADKSVTKSHLTRNMINKGVDKESRSTLPQEAVDQGLLVKDRKIQMSKGGPNPIIYRLTEIGINTVKPFVGDEDLEDGE